MDDPNEDPKQDEEKPGENPGDDPKQDVEKPAEKPSNDPKQVSSVQPKKEAQTPKTSNVEKKKATKTGDNTPIAISMFGAIAGAMLLGVSAKRKKLTK